MKHRALVTGAASVAATALVMTAGILIGHQGGDTAEATVASSPVRTTTGRVERGDLSGTTTKQGTLERTEGITVRSGSSGILTSLPSAGTTVKPGGELYRVDNRPVTLLAGSLPQWRDFESGMSDGPDIGQLERDLHDGGYLKSTPDDHFDLRTASAIRAFQRATGHEATGRIERGDILFAVGDQVVAERSAKVGDSVAPGQSLYSTTGAEKVVHVDLPVGSALAKKGGSVSVVLPDGRRADGRIRSVGEPTTGDDGKTTTTVEIALKDAASVGSLSDVGVAVDFVSDTRTGVLSVPVSALGASSDGGFVVDVVDPAGSRSTKQVPVKVGLFAGDRVEVTSGAITPGQKVVVPL